MQLLADFLGNGRRGKEAKPVRDVEAPEILTELGKGYGIWQYLGALRAGDCYGPELARLDQLNYRRYARNRDRDVASDHILHSGSGAAVSDVLHVDACSLLEKLPG